jgi:integrase
VSTPPTPSGPEWSGRPESNPHPATPSTPAPGQRRPRKAKRGNREGSIVYRPQDRRWEARVTLPDGRRKSFYARTRQEAARRLAEALRDRDRGVPVGLDARQTVSQYLERWLADVVRPGVRPSTYASYAGHVRNHLIPTLGGVRLAQLTPQQVQAVLTQKLAEGLSPRTVQYLRAVLRRALAQALKWGLVARNVVPLTEPPKVPRPAVQPLTAEEARQFLAAVRGDRLEALYVLALTLGLRQGELLGLRWSDVDLDAGTLRVTHALQRIDGVYRLVEPKTTAARRVLPLPPTAAAALRAHRTRQLTERLRLGPAWQDPIPDLVFTRPDGRPLEGTAVTQRFQRQLAAAGLRRVRFHDLRHSCASLLVAQGVPTRVVMEILGHSQVSTTLGIYAHVLPGMQQTALAQLDALVTGPPPSPPPSPPS